MKRVVARSIPIVAGLVGVAIVAAFPILRRVRPAVHPGWDASHRFTLPNGWRLTPAGETLPLPGDMPGNILVLKGGQRALVNTCGFHDHSLNLIDIATGKVLQTIPFSRGWVGLAMNGQGEALVSGGLATEGNEAVHKVSVGAGLTSQTGFSLAGIEPKQQFVSSILTAGDKTVLLNIQSDEVLLLDKDNHEIARTKVGYRPFGVALSPDRSTLAVSNWGDKSVTLLDAQTLGHKKTISSRAMPSAVKYSPDGRLFVTESGSNTIAIIDGGTVKERVRTGIDAKVPVGATPLAMALSPNGKTLYVADAGNNCVTVIDVSHRGSSHVVGLIPTERYPTALAITPDGKKLLISTAKGYYGANAVGDQHAHDRGVSREYAGPYYLYIGQQLQGRLAIVNVPNPRQLSKLTRLCFANRPRGTDAAPKQAVRDRIQHEAFDKIKHVILVIKENRAYDQVLGDIGKGESEPSLVLFGQKVTPNEHKIVGTFTLLDNIYTDGEVSQVGHQWTDSAYGSDYTEKAWTLGYSDHGEVVSDDRMTSSPGEYIWTLARHHGLYARVFGEYVSVQEDHGPLDNPAVKADPEKYGFSAAFEKIFARGGRDVEKVDEFLTEMRAAEKTGRWPSMMVMALPEDHTRGMSAGAFSPVSMVADNDLAVGKLLAGISHSRFWKDTALFVIQDDAQDGADHVDSHRTVGLVASPYVKRGAIDSTMYSTASMLRTMELILHLPPMTQYDEHATPMYAAFSDHPVFTPYDVAPPQVDLNQINPKGTELARRSSKLDFTDIDRADPDEFNRILWAACRPGEPYPALVR